MTDVVGRGVIELITDGRKLKAGIEDAKKSIRTLGEGQKEISKAAQRSIDQYIGRLQLQAATIGKSTRETEIFKLALRGASNEQINAANSALQLVERHKQWTSIGEQAHSIFVKVAAGATIAAGAYAALTLSNIDFADHLKDLNKSTGISVEDLAGLSLLAKQTGTDIDGLAKGINRMSVEIGKSPEDFRALGITAKDNIGAFKQLADLFNQLPDIQQRNALAQKIFGKSWQELAPVLSEGGQRIGEVIERGKSLSGITKEMTDQADQFKDSLEELKIASAAAGSSLVPSFNSIARAMVDARIAGEGFFGTLFEGAKKATQELFRLNNAGDLNKVSQRIVFVADEILRLQDLQSKGQNVRPQLELFESELKELQKKRDILEGIVKLEGQSNTAGSAASGTSRIAQAAAAREKTALAAEFLKQGEEQIKLIQQIAKERQNAAEKSIAADLAATQARLSSSAQLFSTQKELERAELNAIARRVTAAKDAFDTEVKLALARNGTVKQAAQDQLAAGNKLYDGLIARNNDYLNVVKASQAKILSLDRELADSRSRSAEAILNLRLQGMSEEEQAGERLFQADQKQRELEKAAIAGDIELAKRRHDELVALGSTIGAQAGGEFVITQADAAFEPFLERQKAMQQEVAKTADNAAAAIRKQIEEVGKQVTALEDSLLVEIKVQASRDGIKTLVDEIREALALEEFGIKVVPQSIANAQVPGFALGGIARGLAWVGERGPELAQFFAPARIYSAEQSREIVRNMGGADIPGFANGGMVLPDSASSAGGDIAHFHFPKRTVGPVRGSRQMLHDLANAIDELSQGVAG